MSNSSATLTLDWTTNEEYLVARLLCGKNPDKLKSGNDGWFAEACRDWRHGWKLRVDMSLVYLPHASSFGEREYLPPGWAERVVVQPITSAGAVFVTDRSDSVNACFRIPNCLQELEKKGYGSVCAGLVPFRMLPSETRWKFRCTARLFADPPGMDRIMVRAGRGIELRKTNLGGEALVELIEDIPGDWDYSVI